MTPASPTIAQISIERASSMIDNIVDQKTGRCVAHVTEKNDVVRDDADHTKIATVKGSDREVFDLEGNHVGYLRHLEGGFIVDESSNISPAASSEMPAAFRKLLNK
jgi:hypothetical protein